MFEQDNRHCWIFYHYWRNYGANLRMPVGGVGSGRGGSFIFEVFFVGWLVYAFHIGEVVLEEDVFVVLVYGEVLVDVEVVSEFRIGGVFGSVLWEKRVRGFNRLCVFWGFAIFILFFVFFVFNVKI